MRRSISIGAALSICLASCLVGVGLAQAQSKRNTHERVVAYVSVKSLKKWDLRSGPDLSLCIDKKCWPRPKSYAGKPYRGKDIKRPLCKNSDNCWIGCTNQQRIYISRTKSSKFRIYDVDRFRNDSMDNLKCKVKSNKETVCSGQHVSVTLIPYNRKMCSKLQRSKPNGLVH
jgi:hypothetical protein